eukprot:4820651-Karenia_brevis.AAC.1
MSAGRRASWLSWLSSNFEPSSYVDPTSGRGRSRPGHLQQAKDCIAEKVVPLRSVSATAA